MPQRFARRKKIRRPRGISSGILLTLSLNIVKIAMVPANACTGSARRPSLERNAVNPGDLKRDAEKRCGALPVQPRIVRSEDLLAGAREAIILHGEIAYRLVLTRNGKLILQK